jgi:hypothetical protein
MNAPPFPLNPWVGQRWQNWMWNGSMWVCTPAAGVQVLTKVFNASGPYMPSAGLVSLVVETIGGGGGGGAVEANLPVLWIVGGAGGGSGGYSRKTLPASLVLGGVVVTVGAGGLSNANGGPTSFGALCVANGGFGANVDQPEFGGVAAGAGGVPGIGDFACAGATGDNGFITVLTAVSSNNGACAKGGQVFGGNLTGEVGPGQATNGPVGFANSGAGGGGAAVNQSVTTQYNGGAGGSGICIATEYIWADVAPGEDCGCAPGARVAIESGWRGHGEFNDD